MSSVSPERSETAPKTPPSSSQPLASSSVTPTFAKAIFQPTTKSPIYSPDNKTAPKAPHFIAEAGDLFTPEQDTTLHTPVTVGSETSPSAWSKRKPVPGFLVLPNETVPSSHPFARSFSSAKPSPVEELTPEPLSPRHGPLPPRRQGAHSRNVSGNQRGSPLSPAESTLSGTSGLFWAPPMPQAEPSGLADEMEVLAGDEDGDKGNGLARKEDDPEATGSPSVGPHSKTDQKSNPASRSSSVNASPRGPSNANTEPSSSVNAAPGVVSSSLSPSPSPEPVITTSGDQHPLRMRFDKSLPALPLHAEAGSPSRSSHTRHLPTASTSSDPSTRIVTPRNADQQYGTRSPEQDARENERTRIQWSKRLSGLHRSRTKKENSKQVLDVSGFFTGKHQGEPDEDDTFSVDRIPSKRRLWEAGTLFLTDEDGDLVCFGDMFPKMPDPVEPGQPIPPIPKTAVFFIRHFWCGQCQDFMFASLSQLDPEALEKAGIKVIIISNGSWKIIKSYRELFKCPFPIYVDGPRKLYQLMGMTKMTNDFGPLFKGRAAYHQRSVPKQLLQGGKNALTKMPLANPGKLTQLGGEFVLSPGYNCDFAHRMTNTSNHMEAPDVLREAGCPHPTKSEVQEITIAADQKAEFERLEREMKEWRAQRESELERIRRRRAERRGEIYNPMANTSRMALGLDADEPESARVAIPIADDSPSSRASSPTPTRSQSSIVGHEEPATDGPVCLPIDSMEDVLAWEPESKVESEKENRKMDEKFTVAMRDLGINLGPEIKTSAARDHAFGRAKGMGNGLDVIEDR